MHSTQCSPTRPASQRAVPSIRVSRRSASCAPLTLPLPACAPVEDEETDTDIIRMYARCKPVAPVTRSVALAGTPAAAEVDMEQEDQALRVFYGNDTYYVLFRLHQYLYDRCEGLWTL